MPNKKRKYQHHHVSQPWNKQILWIRMTTQHDITNNNMLSINDMGHCDGDIVMWKTPIQLTLIMGNWNGHWGGNNRPSRSKFDKDWSFCDHGQVD